MATKREEFIPTRKSLLHRLKNWEDQDSWHEFFGIYRKLIFSTALKAGLSEPEAEDVLQETVISVAKTIKDFKYDRKRCTFKSWLGHLTRKRIADQFRQRKRSLPGAQPSRTESSSRTTAIERVPDPESLDLEAVWEREWQQELLDAAVERIRSQVNAEQYQMFDFYVLRKMPVGKVASALGVNIAQVYLAKHRVSKLIKQEVKSLEKKMS